MVKNIVHIRVGSRGFGFGWNCHSPDQYRECSSTESSIFSQCTQTNAKSYVDDNFLHIKTKKKQSLQEAVVDTIRKIEDYTNANQLALNPEKSRIMIISNDKKIKEDFVVSIGGKELHHQKKLMVLGNIITKDLTWKNHVDTIVVPALANRVRLLRQIFPFMDQKF